MVEFKIEDLPVTSENSYDRGPLRDHNHMDQEPSQVRWTTLSFLDLPAEIRNTIYHLSCAPISDTSPPPFGSQDDVYFVTLHTRSPIYLSSLPKLCRQIRKEYLPLLLWKHEVTFGDLKTARRWLDIFGDEIARTARRLRLDVALSISFSRSTSTKDTTMQLHTSTDTQRIRLNALYDFGLYGRPCLHYHFFYSHAITRQSSGNTIHGLILQKPFNDYDFTLGYFLSLTEHIFELGLQGYAIDAPARPELRVAYLHQSFHVFPPSNVEIPGCPKEDKVQVIVTGPLSSV